jgi:lipopolysaccharide export system protein LptC
LSTSTEFNPAAPASAEIRQRAAIDGASDGPGRHRHSRTYSRFVSLMKFLLPVAALAVIVLVVAWPHINTRDLKFRLGITVMKLTGSDDPSMINPRYVGTDSDNQPFSITADLARNITEKGMRVTLVMPKADITLEDGTWLVLTANDGEYSREEKALNLAGQVNLYHDSGYEFRTERAAIDLTTGTALSNDPVSGQGPFGRLAAAGFRMMNKGKVIHFLGKSKLTLYPGAKPPTP